MSASIQEQDPLLAQGIRIHSEGAQLNLIRNRVFVGAGSVLVTATILVGCGGEAESSQTPPVTGGATTEQVQSGATTSEGPGITIPETTTPSDGGTIPQEPSEPETPAVPVCGDECLDLTDMRNVYQESLDLWRDYLDFTYEDPTTAEDKYIINRNDGIIRTGCGPVDSTSAMYCRTDDSIEIGRDALYKSYVDPITVTEFGPEMLIASVSAERLQHDFGIPIPTSEAGRVRQGLQRACIVGNFANWAFENEKLGTTAEVIDALVTANSSLRLAYDLGQFGPSGVGDEEVVRALAIGAQGDLSECNVYVPKRPIIT